MKFGVAQAQWFGAEIPIRSVLGDQQAALFGHTCLDAGSAKIHTAQAVLF